MRRFDWSVTAALLIFVLLGTFPLWGQSTAEVRGKVTDVSHQPVVSAFVGVTANSQIDDRLFTPFGMTPGTEINAAAFETMAQGTFLIDVEPLWENLVVLGLLAAIGLAFRYLPGWWAYGTGGLLLLGATLIPYVFFIHQRVFPFATSFLVAWLGTLIGREQV